ncbi:MAG: hypothetical protein MRY78_17980 [Saprospiraceae bacterium]|nr:hypothetical protein [Saprospiraceae bacterium]
MKDQLLEAAKAVLLQNWTGHFTKPAPNLYPHQWNWDAGFIAIGYAHFDLDKAEQELRSLFKGQWSNGMLPQIVFGTETNARYFPGPDFWWTHLAKAATQEPQTSGISMPPVHGFALWRIYQIAKKQDPKRARAFLEEMFPKVLKSHQYFYEFRDPQQEGLVYIRHPWEGGTDNSPIWDSVLEKIDPTQLDIPPYERKDLQNPEAAAHRPSDLDYDRYVHLVDVFRKNKYDEQAIYEECPFLIQDPLFNGALVWSNECLIKAGQELGEPVNELIHWNELTIFSLNEKLWDEERGIYNAYDLKNDQLIPVHTNSGLMPMIGEVPTQEQAEQMLLMLEGADFCGSSENIYSCPTYSLQAEDVNYKRYWRGPVWINMNWLLYHGLLRYDMEDMAAKVKRDSLELIGQYGFYEYFDPRKDKSENLACGTNQFSWTAALCIDFLMET